MNFQAFGVIMSAVSIPLFIVGLLILIIQAIRKKKKKPALIVMLMSVVLLIGGFGVTLIGDTELFPPNKSEAARDEVEAIIYAEYMDSLLEGDAKGLTVNITTEEVNDDEYAFYGKYSIVDNYGDKYTGKFEIVLAYQETHSDGSISFSEKKVDIGTAYK